MSKNLRSKTSAVLFILHIPPPINGAAMVGEFIRRSKAINESFGTTHINLTTAFHLNDIGKGGLYKGIQVIRILKQTVKALLRENYALCYMTLTATGAGFYKDFLVVLVLKLFRKNIIYHFHNKGVKENSARWPHRLLYRLTFSNTQVILLAPQLYDDISHYVDADKVYYCPNGMPDITTEPSPKIKMRSPHEP